MLQNTREMLRLVTVWHPDHFLQCSSADLESKPHFVRTRELSNRRRVEQAESFRKRGIHLRTQVLSSGNITAGFGKEVKEAKRSSMHGSELKKFQLQTRRPVPVLVRVPDEEAPRAKWKIELRTLDDWQHNLREVFPTGFLEIPSEVALPPNEQAIFWLGITESSLHVNGLWINPTGYPHFPRDFGANLVLGPRPAQPQKSTRVRLVEYGDWCEVDWTMR